MRQAIAVLGILMICSVWGMGQTVYKDYVDGQIYVRLKSPRNPKTGKEINPTEKFDKSNHPFNTFLSDKFRVKPFGRAFRENASSKLNATLLLEFGNYSDVEEIIRELEKDKNVELVEKVPLYVRHLDPNDPGAGNQWALSKISANVAWNYFSTGSKIVIAIVDDAVERTHPDLGPNIWVNTKEIPGNGIDDDGNGYVDDINGWDLGDNDNNPDPPTTAYDHGTHVAGIASAATNNGIGMSSIGFSCKIMCIKATAGNPNSIIASSAGIIYAANNGANVINCSFGSSIFSSTGQETIDYAISKGCIVVASAGNTPSSAFNYPAAYNGVISVANTDINDVKSSLSTYGEWVKISAPGSAIYSTIPFGLYGNKSGTSMASPMVAGLVGLMKSLNPGMPNNELIQCLYQSADNILDKNPLYPGQLGAGRINAEKAMACVAATLNKPPVADFSFIPATVVQGSSITFSDKSVYNPTTWEWSFPGGTPSVFSGKTPPPIVYNTSGQYNISLTVTNAFGTNTKTIPNAVRVNDPPSCVSIHYPVPAGTVLDFLAPPAGANGFQNGVNANGDKQKAMYFDVSDSVSNLIGLTAIYVRFNHINNINLDKKVYFRVFDGTSGTPGAQLGVVERTKGQLRQNVLAGQFTMIDLTKNIDLPASKKFFVSVDISELVWTEAVKDSLSIRALVGAPPVSPVWYQNAAGTWINYGTQASTWGNAAQFLLVHPFLTSKPAKSIISPINPVICLGSNVELDATGSVYNDLLRWEFPGANAPTVVENQLKVTPQYTTLGVYKVYLSTRGGCSETRIDSTLITVNASPTINITSSKNPICAGETATLNASGGDSYTWSPATGLNVTTGPQVLANPAVTITYIISGIKGGCTSEVPFELEVRAKSATISLNASETAIAGPTSVTFTAAGSNGGPTPSYNFLVNNSSVQNGINSTLIRTVSPGDKIVCVFTTSEPCVDEATITSNEILMGDITVPISLLTFTGKKSTAGNQLNWITSSESNSDRFIIEKSADGIQFTAIGFIMAAGNSNAHRTYAFMDMYPSTGKNFYRLKLQDKDATYKYSNIVMVENSSASLIVSLYPNPTSASQSALLNLQGVSKGRVEITIHNTAGQVIRKYQATTTNGGLQINLSAPGITSGNYLVVCRDEQGIILKTLKWMVHK